MKLATGLVFAALALGAAAAITDQNIFLVGDETMAKSDGISGCHGWGEYLQDYMNATVVNKAIAGSSAKSYWADNHFNEVASLLKKNDIVIIEFGHHDNITDLENFPRYLNSGILTMVYSGAVIIISSPTPLKKWKRNSNKGPYEGTYVVDTEPTQAFVAGSEQAVKMNSYSTVFVDHLRSMVRHMDVFLLYRDQEYTNSFFCNDEIHLSDKGAQLASEYFVEALVCSDLSPGYYGLKKNLPYSAQCRDIED
ncbi:hypothetical protein B7494_g4574 [Chlorociboria aeruginascens]|nr:hypothetical protein B7494_g4574 [Chlorociboria aeruginascens]